MLNVVSQPAGQSASQRPDFATVTSDDLVTGEAVALDLPPAGLGVRIASGLIDVLVTVALLFGVLVVAAIATINTDDALLWVAFVGTMIVVFLVVPTVLETATRGRSLGKMALGLRTVRDDGGPISFHHALVRALIGFVEIYAFSGAPAFLSAMMNTEGKRLGDLAAGTYVVRERVPLTLRGPVPMPPPLAAWAAAADVRPLPAGLAVGIRQFLARAVEIRPEARERMGRRLADQVAGYVAPPPPPGTPNEAFLAAVLATRRERDLRRLADEDRFRARLLTGQVRR